MQVEHKEIGYCHISANYKSDASAVLSKEKEAIAALKKQNVRISGFRPGKATDLAIKVKLKKQMQDWIKSEMVKDAFNDVLFETKYKAMGIPNITRADLFDNIFVCDMSFYVRPKFNLVYDGLEIPKPLSEINAESQAQKDMHALRESMADFKPVNDADSLLPGDKITISLLVLKDKEVIEALDGQFYTIGNNKYKNLDETLVGMKQGQEVSFKSDDLDLTVKVLAALRATLPPLDDDFAKMSGFESLEVLNTHLKSLAEHKVKFEENSKIKEQLVLKLLKENDFDPPSFFVSQEFLRLKAQIKSYGKDVEKMSKEEHDNLHRTAKDNVKLMIILEEVREKEPESNLSQQDVLGHLELLLSMNKNVKDPKTQIQKMLNDGSYHQVAAKFKDEATLEFLVRKVKIIE